MNGLESQICYAKGLLQLVIRRVHPRIDQYTCKKEKNVIDPANSVLRHSEFSMQSHLLPENYVF